MAGHTPGTDFLDLIGENSEREALLRRLLLAAYEEKAITGDHDAIELLFWFAKKAEDESLLERFTLEKARTPRFQTQSEFEAARAVREAIAKELGIDPELIGHAEIIHTPTYKFR